jgi:hypothetical protein
MSRHPGFVPELVCCEQIEVEGLALCELAPLFIWLGRRGSDLYSADIPLDHVLVINVFPYWTGTDLFVSKMDDIRAKLILDFDEDNIA